jgi:hypothetical protein
MMASGIVGMQISHHSFFFSSRWLGGSNGFFFAPAEPHAEISHTEFYKHIGSEEMENARMKQLLSWSGRRALDAVQNALPVPDDPAYHIGM